MLERVCSDKIGIGDELYVFPDTNASKFRVMEIGATTQTLWMKPLNAPAETYGRGPHKNLMPFSVKGFWYKEKTYMKPIKRMEKFSL